jgi:hypothetical protein
MPPATLVLVELKQPGRTNASQDAPVSKTLTYVEKLKSGHAKTAGGAVIAILSPKHLPRFTFLRTFSGISGAKRSRQCPAMLAATSTVTRKRSCLLQCRTE